VYSPVMMIKAFEPLIVAQQGRIGNIGSVSGILASPNLPAYEMSKHAIEALTDSLAVELAPLNLTRASRLAEDRRRPRPWVGRAVGPWCMSVYAERLKTRRIPCARYSPFRHGPPKVRSVVATLDRSRSDGARPAAASRASRRDQAAILRHLDQRADPDRPADLRTATRSRKSELLSSIIEGAHDRHFERTRRSIDLA
jgi:hypothetical protein